MYSQQYRNRHPKRRAMSTPEQRGKWTSAAEIKFIFNWHIFQSTINIGILPPGPENWPGNSFKNRNINIACIQETKLEGAKAKDIGEGYNLFYNGQNTN